MSHYILLKSPTDVDVARAAANRWFHEISSAGAVGKQHLVALSGGRIAKHLFTALADKIKAAGTTIGHVHFFWADERCVPPEDAESNFITANQLLFGPLAVPAENIHRLRGELEPSSAVTQAIAEINQYAPRKAGWPVLDLVILGMGEDGHVASLFPNASAEVMNCAEPFLAIHNSPKPPLRRISLSYGAIAAANDVWVLASGKGKEAALRESLSPAGQTPLARVLKSRDSSTIFSDIDLA